MNSFHLFTGRSTAQHSTAQYSVQIPFGDLTACIITCTSLQFIARQGGLLRLGHDGLSLYTNAWLEYYSTVLQILVVQFDENS